MQIYEPVAAASAGIWRVSGPGWSLVLKVLRHSVEGHRHWRSGEDEDHWYYWRREAVAYESGLLSSLAGQLRPPRCALVAERPDGSVALWLEDAGGTPGVDWATDHYGLAARHLGQAQGEFAAGRSLPPHRWLSRDWLRAYLAQRDGDLELVGDPEAWRRGPLREWFPAPPVEEQRAMRAGQDEFLAALDGMPQTVCHFDLHPANLFSVGGETVLIDWSFVGIGPVGMDPATLVADAVLDFHVAADRADALFEHVLEGYVEGLADAGWRGNRELVRLAMAATVAARYAWIAPAMLRVVEQGNEQLNRRPLEAALQWWAPAVEFLLRQTARARDLQRRLNG